MKGDDGHSAPPEKDADGRCGDGDDEHPDPFTAVAVTGRFGRV